VIPLKDYNVATRRPIVTLVIIAACVAVYFFVQPVGQVVPFRHNQSTAVQQADQQFTFSHAAIPCELTHGRPLGTEDINGCAAGGQGQPFFPHKNIWLAVLYSMFLHGSLLHIGGNMLYLWIFGNNVEDRFGHLAYLVFYLAAGVVATAVYVALDPASIVPLIGASGAIAGVMGAYLVLFPRAPINSLILFPPIVLFRRIQARWLLLFWIASQFLLSPGSGVAWTAHVGGFAFGVLVGFIWLQATGGRDDPRGWYRGGGRRGPAGLPG
jgi:membrane associated rhomboid family serine protease